MTKMIAVLMSSFMTTAAFAWDQLGHRTVAEIAFQKLSPTSLSAVQSLLGNDTLVDASTWADQIKKIPLGLIRHLIITQV